MKHFARALLVAVIPLVASSSLSAQAATQPTTPSSASTAPFQHGLVIGSDWLQANSLPLERTAVHSGAIDVSLRRDSWSLNLAWLRIARNLSTVQGGAVSIGRPLRWGRVLFIPALSALGGQAQASRDSTGYDYTSGSTTGHVPRYSYSSAATFGGGGSLTVEIPLYRVIGIRGVAQQWYFSGAPLDGDRPRTLLGAGVSLRVGR